MYDSRVWTIYDAYGLLLMDLPAGRFGRPMRSNQFSDGLPRRDDGPA